MALTEGPMVTEGNWQEFLAECSMIEQYKNSDAVLRENRRQFQMKLRREAQERAREAFIREYEESWQAQHRDEIRAENEAAAKTAAEHACKHCFCIHAGEC